jgi:hypothetical protein
MPVYFDRKKKRWRFTFNRVVRRNGRRYRARSTKLLPKGWGAARRERYDLDETARLYAAAAGLERAEPTIGQAVALYLDERVPKLRNGKKVAQDLAHLIDDIEGRPISQFADLSAEYVKEHPELADGTLHNRLAYLKAAGRYAWKRRRATFGPGDPTDGMVIPRPNNARDVQIPIERIWQLLRKLREIDVETCALYTLALRTGVRWIKGIHARAPEDVVRAGRDVWLKVGITKNGTPRMKWVHPDARWALAYLPFRRGPNYYYNRFRLARRAVALPETWAHDMRHVIATDIIWRGGSLQDVGAALDHLSAQSSQRYAHVMPRHVKRVLSGVGGVRKMHTRPRKKKAA